MGNLQVTLIGNLEVALMWNLPRASERESNINPVLIAGEPFRMRSARRRGKVSNPDKRKRREERRREEKEKEEEDYN